MQPLDLNLASNPFRNNTLLWLGYATAVVALAAFTVWNIEAYREHRRLLRELRNEVGTFQSQRLELENRARSAQAAIEQTDVGALRVQAAKANEVINWKAFSWTRLFNQMERIQPHEVRMNAIRPIFRGPRRQDLEPLDTALEAMPVAIEGTARNFADFAELEQLLQNDAHFGQVLPERVNRSPSGEIVFELQFLYRPQLAAGRQEAAGEERDGATEPQPQEAAETAAPPAAEAAPAEVAEAWPRAVAAEGADVRPAQAEASPAPSERRAAGGRR